MDICGERACQKIATMHEALKMVVNNLQVRIHGFKFEIHVLDDLHPFQFQMQIDR